MRNLPQLAIVFLVPVLSFANGFKNLPQFEVSIEQTDFTTENCNTLLPGCKGYWEQIEDLVAESTQNCNENVSENNTASRKLLSEGLTAALEEVGITKTATIIRVYCKVTPNKIAESGSLETKIVAEFLL